METPGEDSGFGYEDPLNLLEEGSHGISVNVNPNADESDEGIEVNAGFGVNQDYLDDPGVIVENIGHFVEGGVIPPHIQLQMAQEQFHIGNQPDAFEELIQQGNNQQEFHQHYGIGIVPELPIIMNQQVLLMQDPPGDDNNNDRPDDVNNNTTDPNLRQQQQMILEQRERLAQQHEQFLQLENDLQAEVVDHEVKFEVGDGDVGDNEDNNGEVEILTNGNTLGKKDKRKKKKKKKKVRFFPDSIFKEETDRINQNENIKPDPEVEIEYVAERLELSVFDPMYRAFANVFENFRISEFRKPLDGDLKTDDPTLNLKKVPKTDLIEEDDNEKTDDKPKLSKRKLKKLTRLSVAELKQVVSRPDVVEMHDVTAKDPKLLVHLKAYRNTVPVPRHWCYKRKYLQGKRGIEKPPFDLPLFIKKTGIMEMRAALAEKEDQKSLKAKMRERVRPKMGKIDIDYQKLHDAFFKWQTKPKMTIHGDLYYEGKEFETRMKDKKPGDLSDDLRTSLGMPVGPSATRVPPPWLIAMQRYGPPPSYPHLKIPGLNAPIPDSCSFGYHAGGWGKPPVDEFGRPLYGDVFGIMSGDASGAAEEEYIDKSLWGELESEEEESSEEEEEEEEKDEEEDKESPDDSGLQTPAEGMATPSGFSSVPAGLETPESIELRKRRIEQDMEGGDTPQTLFTVLPEKRVDRIAGAMMASTHVYDISAGKEKSKPFGVKDSSAVELALDPSELDLVDTVSMTAAMEARYEQTLKEKQSYNHGEDLSDMVAEHTAKQKNKRKRQMQQQDVKKGAKKQKEFKF